MIHKSPYIDVHTPEGVKVKGILIELTKGVEPYDFEKKVLAVVGRDKVGHMFGTVNLIVMSYLVTEEDTIREQMIRLQNQNPAACKVDFLNDPFVML